MTASCILLAPYDGTSRVPGTCHGALALLRSFQELRPHKTWNTLAIKEDSKNSSIWGKRLMAACEADEIRLTLGGDHFVSFPAIERLGRKYPTLRLVVLDAHHDAYDYPLLTHYSLFHYTAHELHISALMVGVRHESLQNSSVRNTILSAADVKKMSVQAVRERVQSFVGSEPFYLSLDLDVLDPLEFKHSWICAPLPQTLSSTTT
jgi:arginase family enzyme